MTAIATRILLTTEPFIDETQNPFNRGQWPAMWVSHAAVTGDAPAVVAYRRQFDLERAVTFRIHVTADERYEFFLDGERIGRGSERGDRHCWFFESYDLNLPAGRHVLVARVFWLGAAGGAAHAQVTVRPAFLCAGEGAAAQLLTTGIASWECKQLGGYSFTPPDIAWGTSAKTVIQGGQYDWDHERGAGAGWQAVANLVHAFSAAQTCMGPNNWMLRPAMLPAMREDACAVGSARHVQAMVTADTTPVPVRATEHLAAEATSWNRLLSGAGPLTIPAQTQRRVIVDLRDYYCAWPQLVLAGGAGAQVRVRWAEALFTQLQPQPGTWSAPKDNRDEIEGKFFVGVGDTFFPAGGPARRYEPFWWEAGRYVEILVTTATEPVVFAQLQWIATHYPYEFTGTFAMPMRELMELTPLARRALQMCSHETYMDCPYYEQMMYVGDTRLEVLTTYTLTADDRLPRKALRMFDESRGPTGLTQARYPCRVPQYIPPFALYWIAMVHDFARWRDDAGFVRARMPGVRAVLEAFRDWTNADGLIEAPAGWNFVDWVPEWGGAGLPPDGDRGVSGIINWHYVYTLQLAADLEQWVGEPELAARNRRLADAVATTLRAIFWDAARGIYADDRAHRHFSEHSQCFAILAGDRQTRLDAPDLARATIYFTHYLFEASRELGQIDRLFERLNLWSSLQQLGFKTTVEMPEPSRSDCHAWGAHPIYHAFASVLGIRPASFGFREVRITPQLGPMPWARGSMPHPRGTIHVELDGKSATVELPAGVTGTLEWGALRAVLKPGRQTYRA